jgi:serine/threonine protein kinase
MLSGRRAFQGGTAADTMFAVVKEDPPELTATRRDLPPALDRVVRHCLEKNPSERFQTARDVGFALQGLSETSPGAGHVLDRPVATTRRWLRTAGLHSSSRQPSWQERRSSA